MSNRHHDCLYVRTGRITGSVSSQRLVWVLGSRASSPWLGEPVISSIRWDPPRNFCCRISCKRKTQGWLQFTAPEPWTGPSHLVVLLRHGSQADPGECTYHPITANPLHLKPQGWFTSMYMRPSGAAGKVLPLSTHLDRWCAWYHLPFILSSALYGLEASWRRIFI